MPRIIQLQKIWRKRSSAANLCLVVALTTVSSCVAVLWIYYKGASESRAISVDLQRLLNGAKLSRQELYAAMPTALSYIRQGLPHDVDNMTSLTAIDFRHDQLTHTYEVDPPTGATLVDLEYKKLWRPQVIMHACSHALTRNALAVGTSVAYEYVNEEGETLARLHVLGEDC